MKELTIEEKAKRYDEALEKAKRVHDEHRAQPFDVMLKVFPELKESEDEKIKEELIEFIYNNTNTYEYELREKSKSWLAWLEKQGEIDKTSYDISEKEKCDFVSGQFIECRKSFNEFKEDNSYWLEYVGNDTYIGRSDNILNKKFHITPRQLYRLFTQQHCPKKDNANEETNAPTEYGKYVDECLNEASKHFFSEGEDKYSVADLFYAGVRCGKSWLEKQSKQKPYGQRQECADCQFNYAGECKGSCQMKRGEQKLADKDEPKFHEDDWIVNKFGDVWHIDSFDSKNYQVSDGDKYCYFSIEKQNEMHLWTIADAKPGDVLAVENIIFIYERTLANHIVSYCKLINDIFEPFDDARTCCEGNPYVHPATKEQRDLLLTKMREADYEFDFEKKELKKIEQKQVIDYPDSLPKDNWELIHEFINKFGRIPKDEDELNVLIEYVLKRQKPTWSEEDEDIFNYLKGLTYSRKDTRLAQRAIDWLKSIKEKIKEE